MELERNLRRFGKLIPMFFHVVSVTERYEAFQKNRFDLPSGLGSGARRWSRGVLLRHANGKKMACARQETEGRKRGGGGGNRGGGDRSRRGKRPAACDNGITTGRGR